MSAHSSEPESGVNAIAYLAELFKAVELESNSDGQLIKFVNQLIGLDIYGKQFGDIAYKHDFMGPMTVAPTVIERDGNNLTLAVNARRPMLLGDGTCADNAANVGGDHYQIVVVLALDVVEQDR